MDIRALVLKDILHPAPPGSILTIFGPDESLVRFDATEFLPILDPSSMVWTVLLDVGSLRHGSLMKDWTMAGHGGRLWAGNDCSFLDISSV